MVTTTEEFVVSQIAVVSRSIFLNIYIYIDISMALFSSTFICTQTTILNFDTLHVHQRNDCKINNYAQCGTDDSKDMFNQNIFTYAYLGVDKIVHHLGMKEPQKPWYWYYEQFEGFSFAAEWCRIFLFGP